ncbi:hypothetical protein SLS64_008968 [Diaporthe eres]|uniref:Uncharacterized protein n=1 Tax=Diaporthe eres TaxID=83184 RepID=A0ABR1NXV2_DIAER
MEIGEAHDDGIMGSEDTNNTANIEDFDCTEAISSGAVFDASSVDEARKQRIRALRQKIEEIDSVAQDHNKTSSQSLEESRKKCLTELALLYQYVAPRRTTALGTIETVNPVEHLAQSADPSPLLRTTEETRPDSPRSGSPQAVAPITAASVQAMLRECSPRDDGVNGWVTGDSDASTVRSASNAAVWRCQSKYDDSAEEEQQQEEEENRCERPLLDLAGTLTELEEGFSTPGLETSERRDSALAGLEETHRGVSGEKGEAKSPAADRRSAPSSALDSLVIPEERRRRPTKKQTPKQKNTKRSESAVLEPARYTRRLTAAQKGKWVAECECPKCQPQLHSQVRFDDSAMDEDEDGPGLSHEGSVQAKRERRRRMEAEERGEGASSWATSGPDGLDGLDMFMNPRPAPPVPVRRLKSVEFVQGEGAQRRRVEWHGFSPRVHEFRGRRGPRTKSRVMPLGEADPGAQMDGANRNPLLRALSRRFKK